VHQTARSMLIFCGTTALLLLFSAPGLFSFLQLPFIQIGIFRFGVVGTMFFTGILFISSFLSYFDARRRALLVQLTFPVLNAALTYFCLHLGFAYYGYGFMLAGFISCLVGAGVFSDLLANLPYHTFVQSNRALHRHSTGAGARQAAKSEALPAQEEISSSQ
jgi:polysaccharide biosynthesis protein PelG